MKFEKSAKYDVQFVRENMMGPNALKLAEELTATLDLRPGMRVLDLGCGQGLTSIFLAKEYGVRVFATDLWIPATENYGRFLAWGLDDQIIPLHAEANALPFADAYFDAAICIDAYHYFGREEGYMDGKLAPLVKQGGRIALAFPGFKEDYHGRLPEVILRSWTEEDMETILDTQWWANLLGRAKSIRVDSLREMEGHDECWRDWLATDNPYAVNDRASMEAGAGEYMNMLSVLATKL